MSSAHHTPYAFGGPLTSAAMNAPLAQLDSAIHGIDARAFGQVGDGATDDTGAIQDAIDHASRSLVPRAYRIGSPGVDYTLTVAGYGTTGTLAAAASNATIQAALVALVGAGNVVVGVNAIDGGNDATFALGLNVDLLSSYYTNGTRTGPIIYPRAGSQGIGGVVNVFGLALVSATLEVTHDGVTVVTGTQAPGFFPGLSVAALRAGAYSQGLLWDGADAGGPIIRYRPTGLLALTGVGFTGTLIAGHYPFTTAAAKGIEVTGVQSSRFDQVNAVEFREVGVHLWTNLAARGDEYRDWNVSYNRFGIVTTRQWVNPGVGFKAEGDGAATGAWQNNVYGNTFETFQQYIDKGHGQVWGDSDTNWVANSSAWTARTETLATSAAADDIIDTVATPEHDHHEFVAGDTVYFTALTGGAGLVVGKPYYVIAASLGATTFKVSLTLGGAAVDFTTDITAGQASPAFGIYLEAGDIGEGHPRLNVWQQVLASVYAEGTENGDTLATHSNVILLYYPDDGGHGSPTAPVVGTGADLTWSNWRHGSPPVMAGTSFPW